MKNEKKSRRTCHLSSDLKDIIKYILIFGTILVFGVYLLADAEVLGNVKQQERPETSVMIGSGEKFETSFFCKTNRLSGVELFLSTESASVTGSFHVTLYQEEKEIQDWETNRLTISAGDTTYFQLDQRILNCKDRKFRIILDEATGDTGVAAGVINKKDGTQTLAYRAISRPFSKGLVLMAISAASVIMLLVFAFLRRRKVKTEVLFAIIYLFMSFTTLAAVPAFNSPDEYSHFLRSYEVSRGHMTSEGNGGNDLFSYGRTFNSGLIPDFSSKDHVSLWDIGGNINQRIDTGKTQFYGFGNTALYAPTSYLPQAIGIRIADLFTDRPIVLAYGGRVANMLCFGLIFFLAIRFTPVGKNFIALLGLVPMNIQSANSMSADALALALTVAMIVFVLYMRYKEKRVMKKGQLVLMYAVTGFLCLCKVVYMPFCLFLFLIPKERFRNKKNYWLHVACAGTMILLLSFGWLAIASGYLCESQPGVDTAAQLIGILKNPVAFILTFVRSLDAFGLAYLTEMVGSTLGWLNIPVCSLLAVGYLVMMLLQVSRNNDMEGIRMDPFAKIMLAGISILVFGLIFVTLYGQWTAYGYDKILGVQGRYFLPLLLPVVLALKPKRFAEGTNGTPWGLFLGAWSIDLCVYATLFVQALCQYK